MSQWICTKCKETAGSKCPHQRSVFPDDQTAVALASALTVHTVHLDRKTEAFFNLTIYDKCSKLEAVKHLLKRLSVSNNTLKHAFCNHNWVRNSTTLTDCTFECAHRNLSNPGPANKSRPDTFKDVVSYTTQISRRTQELDLKTHHEKDAHNELFGELNIHIKNFFNSYDEELKKLTLKHVERSLKNNDWRYTEQGFWVKELERGLIMVSKTQIKLNDYESLQSLEDFDLSTLPYRIDEEVSSCMQFFNLKGN